MDWRPQAQPPHAAYASEHCGALPFNASGSEVVQLHQVQLSVANGGLIGLDRVRSAVGDVYRAVPALVRQPSRSISLICIIIALQFRCVVHEVCAASLARAVL